MRPVPVPTWVAAVHPHGHRQVLAGPDGDLTSTTIAPVEVLRDTDTHPDGDRYQCVRLYLTAEPDEVEALRAGGVVELTLYTNGLPVFDLATYHGGGTAYAGLVVVTVSCGRCGSVLSQKVLRAADDEVDVVDRPVGHTFAGARCHLHPDDWPVWNRRRLPVTTP